jgi:hypothetical protein
MIIVLPLIAASVLVALLLGGAMISGVVVVINKITAAIPCVGKAVGNDSFKRRYPIFFGVLFTIMSGAFLGSGTDALLIINQDVSALREAFNHTVLIVSATLGILLLGIYIGIAKSDKREHIVLPTILFSTLAMVPFTGIWVRVLQYTFAATEAVVH